MNSVCSVGPPTPPVNLCKSVQSVGGLFSTLLQNRLAEDVLPQNSRNSQNRLAEMFSHRFHRTDWQRDVLPQISQILTDGACLEFCEFCVFCGTSYAPSGSVKICAICGRIVLVAWGLPSYKTDLQRCSPTDFTDSHRCCVFGVL